MALGQAGEEEEEPHTPRPVTRHFDFEDLEELDRIEPLGGAGVKREEASGCGQAEPAWGQYCAELSESPGPAAASDESSRASTQTGGVEGSPFAGSSSSSSEPESSTPRAVEAPPVEDAARPGDAPADLERAAELPGASPEGGPEERVAELPGASPERGPEELVPPGAGGGADPRQPSPPKRHRPRRGRRWALRPSVGTWLQVLPAANAAALEEGEDSEEEASDEETRTEAKPAARQTPGAVAAEEGKFVEEQPMVRRARWSSLTIDLHHFRRKEEQPADAEVASNARRPPPLDALPRWAENAMSQPRQRLKDAARARLSSYDTSTSYPRPQDHKHGTRYVYEQHVLGEGLTQLREDLRRTYNHGCLGQVWKIVGGGDKGGVIVRAGSELTSPQVQPRLAKGSVVEHVSLIKDRLHYRLISGTGPVSGWITVMLRSQDGKDKVIAEKVPLGQDLELEQEAGQKPPVIVGLMAAHIRTEPRLKRFKHVLRSVRRQMLHRREAEFLFVVSWSSPEDMATDVHEAIRGVAREPGYSEFVAGQEILEVRQTRRHSQFQHLQAASHLAEDTLRERWGDQAEEARAVWVIFGDDDDIWHHSRVTELAHAIRSHPFLPGVGVFATTARMQCRHTKRMTDEEMPVTEEQADGFLKQGRGIRLDEDPACVEWRKKLALDPAKAITLPVPQELGLEYFDLCPRLRLVREFYNKTSPEFVAHRYCDLRFNEFLCTYMRKGEEMGLEVSFFFPRCWMLFYATPIPDEKAVKKSVEHDGSTMAVDVNNGHMSANYSVEPPEKELAQRCLEEFKTYDRNVTEARIARYWAAFRNAVEVYLVRYHRDKIDQRLLDCYVWFSICSSFFEFWDKCCQLPKAREKVAYDMLMYLGQGYARTVALSLETSILWLRPNIFLEPECADDQQQKPLAPAYANAFGSYGSGAWWNGPATKNGKKPPWGNGPWGSKGAPFAKGKPVAKGGPPGVFHPGMGTKSGGPVKHMPFGKAKSAPKNSYIFA